MHTHGSSQRSRGHGNSDNNGGGGLARAGRCGRSAGVHREVAVKVPEAPAQGRREEHPCEIGLQQIGRDFVDGFEGDDGSHDRHVQSQDVVERGAEALSTEEERLPCEVEHQLDGVERERDGLLGEASFGPHKP